MRTYFFLSALVAALFFPSLASASEILAQIYLQEQMMVVSIDGVPTYYWLTSTARGHYVTPVGDFAPTATEIRHWSRKYHAWMPHAVFFDGTRENHGGRAIHATTGNEDKHLGTRASHGCVRVSPEAAELFYNLVLENGMDHVKIEIREATEPYYIDGSKDGIE